MLKWVQACTPFNDNDEGDINKNPLIPMSYSETNVYRVGRND